MACIEQMDAVARPALDMIEELQRIGVSQDFDLPQVVVAGDQSSGKSSVLEAISGIPFPRGTNLVTTGATQISMSRLASKQQWSCSIGVIRDPECNGGIIGTDEEYEVGEIERIEEVRERIAKLSKCLITEVPGSTFTTHTISIKVHSPTAPDLTLVDLPGIIRNCTEGQDPGCIAQVDKMIDKFLSQRHTICLAVVPANVDIATVDILERAKKYDEEGNRTIAVITKPDLVDLGAEESLVSTVNNTKKPLKLGYVLVKNRGQKALMEGMTLEDAQEDEERFFHHHSVYSRLPSELVGVNSLIEKLTAILVHRIKALVPEMLRTADLQLVESQKDLEAMDAAPPETAGEKMLLLTSIYNRFKTQLDAALTGVYYQNATSCDRNKICAIAKKAYGDMRVDVVASQPEFRTETYYAELQVLIENNRGEELPGFLTFNVFKQLAAKYVSDWTPVGLECIETIAAACWSAGATFLVSACKGYAHLFIEMSGILRESIDALKGELVASYKKFLSAEMKVPFTQSPAFTSKVNDLRMSLFQTNLEQFLDTLTRSYPLHDSEIELCMKPDELSRRIATWAVKGEDNNKSSVRQEAEQMGAFLESYWGVVSDRFLDNVPTLIMSSFLHRICESVTVRVMTELFPKVEALFKVPTAAQRRRKQLVEKIDRLSKAKVAINALQLT